MTIPLVPAASGGPLLACGLQAQPHPLRVGGLTELVGAGEGGPARFIMTVRSGTGDSRGASASVPAAIDGHRLAVP
jgi:hypothetical protein